MSEQCHKFEIHTVVPKRGKWQRVDSITTIARRNLADWEWRVLIHLSNCSPEIRAKLLMDITRESATAICRGIDSDEIKKMLLKTLELQTEEDCKLFIPDEAPTMSSTDPND